MKHEKNENGMYVLTIWDQEDLHYVAEDVIVGLRHNRYYFDDKGNYIMHGLSEEERHTIFEKCDANMKTDYLNFRENEELYQISFSDALYMPLEEIKEKYLKDILPIARGILRKDTSAFADCFVVSDEMPDSYLDDLLALRWRENLKLWTMQWDQDKKEPERKVHQAECFNALIANAVAHGADWGGSYNSNEEGLKIAVLDLKHALGLDDYLVEEMHLSSGWFVPQLVPRDGTKLAEPDMSHTDEAKYKQQATHERANKEGVQE